jgi:hypothetical protein
MAKRRLDEVVQDHERRATADHGGEQRRAEGAVPGGRARQQHAPDGDTEQQPPGAR